MPEIEETDDFMECIGLDIKPASPEDALMIRLTGGDGYKKIHDLRYWIRHELFAYYDLLKNGISLYKETVHKDTFQVHKIEATKEEYAILRIKYYLQMYYLPWFNSDRSGLGLADIGKAAKMVMDHEDIRSVVDAKEEDLPKNHPTKA